MTHCRGGTTKHRRGAGSWRPRGGTATRSWRRRLKSLSLRIPTSKSAFECSRLSGPHLTTVPSSSTRWRSARQSCGLRQRRCNGCRKSWTRAQTLRAPAASSWSVSFGRRSVPPQRPRRRTRQRSLACARRTRPWRPLQLQGASWQSAAGLRSARRTTAMPRSRRCCRRRSGTWRSGSTSWTAGLSPPCWPSTWTTSRPGIAPWPIRC
mmetsp:Transcript_95780/g.285924  ORF Transcript_95780/g.285924 Transcript_95780/m.285924 type:complete len:208 (+) Transcript_95780:230-853(+)